MRVGLGREDLEQARARGRHAERVAVVGADLEDAAVLHHRHDLLRAADRARGQAAAERLRERDHVRLDAEALGRAARGDAEARLDLVEDQDDAVTLGDLAHRLEVARLGEHDPEVHHRRLHDHAGGLAVLGDQGLDAALGRLGVVERHGDREVDDGLRDAGAVGQRLEVEAVADLVVLDADRDHHAVVVPVVGAEDLHDRVALRVGAGDPDRVHRRLGAGVRVAPARQAPAARELLADDDRVLGRRGEVRAQRVALGDRLADRGVGVALDHRAEPVVEVVELVAVDVPDARPVAALEVDRPRVAQLVGRGDAARQRLLRALVHLARPLRALVEGLLLTLDELSDPCSVELGGGGDSHGFSSFFAALRLAERPGSRRGRCYAGHSIGPL